MLREFWDERSQHAKNRYKGNFTSDKVEGIYEEIKRLGSLEDDEMRLRSPQCATDVAFWCTLQLTTSEAVQSYRAYNFHETIPDGSNMLICGL